ncbi:hypothetical protein LguiA_032467 [Lonicera macranthoides]
MSREFEVLQKRQEINDGKQLIYPKYAKNVGNQESYDGASFFGVIIEKSSNGDEAAIQINSQLGETTVNKKCFIVAANSVEELSEFEEDNKSMALSDGLGFRCYVPSIPNCLNHIGFSPKETENLRVSYGHLGKGDLKAVLLRESSIIFKRLKHFKA